MQPSSSGGSGVPVSPRLTLSDPDQCTPVTSGLPDTPVGERRLGRYVVQGKLGHGGMGTVLEAVDPELDRRVALKVLHRELDARHTTRLRREAQALAKLSHPNVVQVYEVGEVGGQTFVAMELVKGQTLCEWMRHEPRPSWRECVEVYLQVGAGLAAAHEQGLVHRDFKPANAIIDGKGRARVLDFGLARQVDALEDDDDDCKQWQRTKTDPGLPLDASLTRTGTVLGTPAYMPVEQMQGEEVDGRSDQFSFCVALYEAVYGERPFEGATMANLLKSICRGRVRATPRRLKVPVRLRSALQRGLAADREQRWPSMESLLAELERAMAPRWRPWVALGLVAGLGLTVLGVGVWRAADLDAASAQRFASAQPVVAAGEVAPPQAPADARPEVEPAGAGSTSGDGGEVENESSGSGTAEDTLVRARASPAASEQPEPKTKTKTKPKRPKTDRSLRAQLERKLGRCGEDGTIEITADYVLATGELLQGKVEVRGPAAKRPDVRACAQSHLRKFRLLPREEVSLFVPLVVKL